MVYAIVLQTLKQKLAYILHEVFGWESILQASSLIYVTAKETHIYILRIL